MPVLHSRLRVLLLILHASFWLWFSTHLPFFHAGPSFLDFDTYVLLAKAVLTGINPYTVSHMTTLGPPLVILPFVPFSYLPLGLAQFIFFILNVFSGYFLVHLLTKSIKRHRVTVYLATCLLLFIAFPTRFSLLMGQPALMVALLIVFSLTNRRSLIYVVPTLVIFKTFFVWILLPLVKTRKKIVLMSLGAIVFLALACSPLIPPKIYIHYIRNTLLPLTQLTKQEKMSDYYNQSLKSTLHRLNLEPYYLPITSILAIFFATRLVRTGNLGLGISTSIFLSPIVWQHYFVSLYPLLILYFIRSGPKTRLLLAAIFFLISVQFPGLHKEGLKLPAMIVASHQFWGLCLLIGLQLGSSTIETQPRQIRSTENLS